ncbi:MAG: CPBP family intramembrane metalloprotease [Streptosporangiales bacterium]|nr:CPBP family intramembrane metalloprotease [Streptosporangiales bacterium]
MMFTPSIAVLVVWLVARRHGLRFRELARDTGLGLGPRKRRTVAVGLALWLGVPVFVAVTVLASAALGLYRLDLTGFSLFKESLAEMPVGDSGLAPTVVIGIMLGSLLFNPLINAVPSLGEEWGWRGWLLPRLLPHGQLVAIVVSGVSWGVWHAPLTLLGYNYAQLGAWAALMFVPFCVLFGAVLAWTRLVTGSVWPAVIGHGALNGSSFLVILLGAAGQTPNLAIVGPIGVVGLALLGLGVAVLYGGRRLRGHRRPGAVAAEPVGGTVEVQVGGPALNG